MFSKIISFCLILLQCSVPIQSLECPQCVDFQYKFFDMPGTSESSMDEALKMLGNIECRTNHEQPSSCNNADLKSTDKCTNVFSTVVIRGMKGVDDNAGMRLETVTRGCTSRPKDEPDKCVDFSDIDGYDSGLVKRQLEAYKSVFNTITLNGQVCYNSNYTNGYQQPLQKASANWLESFANRVHISNVLYVISLVFSVKFFF